MIRSILPAALGLLCLACATGSDAARPGGAADADPLSVTLFDYRTSHAFQLVNKATTGRLELYSKTRDNADCKVQENEVMAELVAWLSDHGFDKVAAPGKAPAASSERMYWSLEVDGPSGSRYVVASQQMSDDQKQTCRDLKVGFLQIYNGTYGLQSVKVETGESPFENPADRRRKK